MRTQVLTVREVAAALRLSPAAVVRRLADGRLLSRSEDDVARYIRTHVEPGRTPMRSTDCGLPKLYTLAEVAELTGLSQRVLADGARAGKFEHIRYGNRRFMTEDQVNALVRANIVRTPPAASNDPLEKARMQLRAKLMRPAPSPR